MNKDQAAGLMIALGSKVSSLSGDWTRGPCPLAPYTHKSGKDSNPSFGLCTAQGEPGRFHCFSCESGSLSRLLQLIEFHALNKPGHFKGNLQKAREIIEQQEIDLPVLPEYSEFTGGHKKQFQPLPDYWLETWKPVGNFPRPTKYLQSRGFTFLEGLQWDLRYDEKNDRVIFPYKDVFGRLAGLRGRGVELDGKHHWSPHHDYVWNDINNSSLTWFNEIALDRPGPIVIVEGQFDALRVARVYPQVMANLTAKPIPEKMAKLAQAEGTILMLDGDVAGRTATRKFAEFLDVLGVPTAVVLLPMTDAEGHEIKTDPDKLGEVWIAEALTNLGLPIDKPGKPW